MWQMIKIMNDNSKGNKIMHQLNEEVRCLRQTLSHLQYRIKHETDKETKNKLMGDYNSYNLILLSKLKELEDNDEF